MSGAPSSHQALHRRTIPADLNTVSGPRSTSTPGVSAAGRVRAEPSGSHPGRLGRQLRVGIDESGHLVGMAARQLSQQPAGTGVGKPVGADQVVGAGGQQQVDKAGERRRYLWGELDEGDHGGAALPAGWPPSTSRPTTSARAGSCWELAVR